MESTDFYGKTRHDATLSSSSQSHLLTKSLFCAFYERLEMIVKFKLLQGYKTMEIKETTSINDIDQAGSSAEQQ